MDEQVVEPDAARRGPLRLIALGVKLVLFLVVLLLAAYVLIYAPELHDLARRIREPGATWFGRTWPGWFTTALWLSTGALAVAQLLFLAGLYGYALMASVRRLYWCAHRRRAVRRWRPIAAAAGLGPVRRWMALRIGTNAPAKASVRRLWAARTPPWLGRGLVVFGFAATIAVWVNMGAALTSLPSGIVVFVLVVFVYLGDERAPSVFASPTVGRHAEAE
ncbi:hypothetical protein [Tsukamurella pseudospumae]|uniref:Uncharacterized protein n=1 Tax=Tsukamurella pseudospumae TaxID=239498 RepID=A0A138AVR5_9ACTN|nr:hypothetical protein [Tsukamurella pseudospumae]KXP14466.1 hypothetical protein AXK60_00705 [Tsukamurella pseudospumae]